MNVRALYRIADGIYHTRKTTSFEKSLTAPLPRRIQIEPTVRCNLHCITCTRDSVIDSYKKMDMTLEDIDKILTLFPDLQSIKFQGLGEPLLTKNIQAILKKFKEKNVRLSTISNGTIFHKERYRQPLLDYFRVVRVSIDSTSAALFSKLRVGANLEHVLSGLRILAQERDRQKKKLSIGINFVVSHENYHEVANLYDIAVENSIDFVGIPTVENWTIPDEDGFGHFSSYVAEAQRHTQEIATAVQALKMRLRRKGILVSYSGLDNRVGHCYWPFKSLFISVEGYVTPCCIRMHRTHAMGNIFEVASLEELWNGPRYRALREAHLAEDLSNPMCGRCPK